MSSDGVSLRINVDDGKVTVDGSHKFKDGDASRQDPARRRGRLHQLVQGHQGDDALQHRRDHRLAGARRRRRTTACSTPSARSASPVNGPVAFNIVSSGPDQNDAWLATGGALYSVDLKTGKATMAGKIAGLTGTLSDIAWMNYESPRRAWEPVPWRRGAGFRH